MLLARNPVRRLTDVIIDKIDHLIALVDAHQEVLQNQYADLLRQFEIVYAKIMRHLLKPQYKQIKQEYLLSLNMSASSERKIRIGRLAGSYEKGLKCPFTYGYKNIIICANKLDAASGTTMPIFDPYRLQTPDGRFFLNIWRAAHVYRLIIPCSKVKQPPVAHTYDDTLLPDYWEWRENIMNSPTIMKFSHSDEQPYILWPSDTGMNISYDPNMITTKMGASRKMQSKTKWIKLTPREAYIRIYCALYIKLIKLLPEFTTLLATASLQIIDRGGPVREIDHLGLPILPYEQMPHGIYGEHGVGSIPLNAYTIKCLLSSNLAEPLSPAYLLGLALLNQEHLIHK